MAASGPTRTIWAYWEQGEADLKAKREPALPTTGNYLEDKKLWDGQEHKYRTAHRCVEAWRRLNPGWQVQLLDQGRARALSPAFDELIAKGIGATQIWSDVLRLDLLHRYGGVWTDVQVCPVHPLDAWLPAALHGVGFFAPWWMDGPLDPARDTACEHSLTDPRDGQLGHLWGASGSRVVLTSFIAVNEAQHPIVSAWLGRTMAYMRSLAPGQPYPYFIAFCELTRLCLDDDRLRDELWEKMPRVDGHQIVGDPTCCKRLEPEVDERMLMYKAPMAGANISDPAYDRWLAHRTSIAYRPPVPARSALGGGRDSVLLLAQGLRKPSTTTAPLAAQHAVSLMATTAAYASASASATASLALAASSAASTPAGGLTAAAAVGLWVFAALLVLGVWGVAWSLAARSAHDGPASRLPPPGAVVGDGVAALNKRAHALYGTWARRGSGLAPADESRSLVAQDGNQQRA
jgi:hypothetical protein